MGSDQMGFDPKEPLRLFSRCTSHPRPFLCVATAGSTLPQKQDCGGVPQITQEGPPAPQWPGRRHPAGGSSPLNDPDLKRLQCNFLEMPLLSGPVSGEGLKTPLAGLRPCSGQLLRGWHVWEGSGLSTLNPTAGSKGRVMARDPTTLSCLRPGGRSSEPKRTCLYFCPSLS